MAAESEGPLRKAQQSTWIARYLGPLVPIMFAAAGVWLLGHPRHVIRMGRGSGVYVVEGLDAQIHGAAFISLAFLIGAIGASGPPARWLFWIGLAGTACSLTLEGARMLAGCVHYIR